MKLHVINSNSMGNAYLLTDDKEETLLIECGVRYDIIKKALKFKMHSVAGCLLSHEHKDHSKSINDLLKSGINVWSHQNTHRACDTCNHHRAKFIKHGQTVKVGSFYVMAFDVEHDAAAPLGYLIHHPECGNVLFLTDSYYCKYKFKNLNNIIIEANYCKTIVDARMRDGDTQKVLRDRVLESHMSIQTCKELLQANDLSLVNNIILIHLSDGNSDAKRFKREVQELTGKQVHVSEPGLIVSLDKNPF